MNAIQGVNQRRTIQLNELLNNSKNKSIVVGAVTLLLFLFLMIFGALPSFRSVLAQNRENREIAEVIDSVESKINLMEQLIEESEEKETVLTEFESIFPSELSQDNFIEEINDLVGESLYLESIGFPSDYPTDSSEISSSEKVKEASISLQLQGTKKDLIDFFRKLEQSRRILNITNLNLTRQSEAVIQEKGFEREFEMSVVLNYYYWGDIIIEE